MTEAPKIDWGGPAFPELGNVGHNSDWQSDNGMMLRDYFAAHAPAMPDQWLKDSPRKKSDPLWHWGEAHAAWAYFYADALIAIRNGGA